MKFIFNPFEKPKNLFYQVFLKNFLSLPHGLKDELPRAER